MAFETTRRGTRGARQPGGKLLALMNRWTMRRIRGGKDGMPGGPPTLVLTTTGRKSGVERQNPVNYFPDGGDGWLIVASAGGAAGNPAWYHNVAAHPDKVRIEVAGQAFDVVAEQLSGPAREEAWQRVVAGSPRFAEYREKTDRELPVIRLRRRR